VSALAGKDLPALNVHILEPIAGFKVTLKRSDGKALEVKGGGKPGVTRVVELPQPEGHFGWEGELLVNFPNGTTDTMPLKFETDLFGKLKLTIDKDKDVDVAGRKLAFTLNHPTGKVQLKVLMDTGRTAFDGEILFNGEPAGTRLEVTWPEAKGKPLQVSFRAFDTGGFNDGVDFFPWQIDIHDEVNFDSGKSVVRDDQRAKLDAAYQAVADAVERYGEFAPVKLFLLGHTDTQGDAAANRTLSLERARSIGAYLRRKGLKVPMSVEGFGEQALRVPTPDETDEAKNRRADYILSIEPPVLNNAPFSPRWQRL
jgi:outer membrane protein OmpA-like peptidoglycan-associated protein